MKYSCITQHKNTASISLQCQVLGVHRSGYYHYRANRANNPVDSVHQEMAERVKTFAEHSRDSYGARRMKKALTVLGYPVTRDKARKLMREAGVQWCNYQTRDEAQQDVLNDIAMFYNRSRLHSYLDYISPNDFESQLWTMKNVV